MLRCAARRRILHVPIVTLDFLLPRYYVVPGRRRPLIKGMQIRTPLASFPSSSTSPPPVSLYTDDHSWLDDEDTGSLDPQQRLDYNEQIAELKKALQDHDISKAWKNWAMLAEQHLLRLLGPPQYDEYSRLLADIDEVHSAGRSLSAEDLGAMESMMVAVAARGAVDGLKARMRRMIKEGNPDAAIRVYRQYAQLIQDKAGGKQKDDGEGNGSEVKGEDFVPEDPESDGDGIAGNSSTLPAQRVSQTLLFYAVVACAMKDSVLEALHLVLEIHVSLNMVALSDTLAELGLSTQMNAKVLRYVDHVKLARLVGHPAAFSRHLSNLARDRADKSLQKMYTHIVKILRRQDPWFALRPDAVSERSPVLLPSFTWSSFLAAFLRCRRLDLATQIWDDMAKFGIAPDTELWVKLLEGYAHLRMIGQARTAWSILLQQDPHPLPSVYRAMIYAEFCSEHPGEAIELFKRFKQDISTSRATVDASSILPVYNTVIHWLLFLKMESEAIAVMQDMRNEGPTPDVITYNTFMRYYARNTNLKALASTLQEMTTAQVKGDVFTYSIVLTALVPVRKDAIQIVFNLMKKHGVKPNVALYSYIIEHLMKQQTEPTFKAAMDLLRKMEAQTSVDVQPNEVTYTTILSGLHRSSWLDRTVAEETAQYIVEKMADRNMLNSRVTYNILIKACLENPEPEGVTNALRYYREMTNRRVFIANDTWYILLSGLTRRQEWGLANEFVEEIEKSGFIPPASLRSLMSSIRSKWLRSRELDGTSLR